MGILPSAERATTVDSRFSCSPKGLKSFSAAIDIFVSETRMHAQQLKQIEHQNTVQKGIQAIVGGGTWDRRCDSCISMLSYVAEMFVYTHSCVGARSLQMGLDSTKI